MFRYFRCVGTELRSQTIIANAWANRADCFSSLAVIIGVIGARFGFHHLDPIAAVVVAIIIIKVCINCVKEAVAGLMDRSVSRETLDAVRKIVSGMDQIQVVKSLRARLLGNKIWIELGVQVAAGHTVINCESIRDQVRQCIAEEIGGVGEVFVDFGTVEES